MTSSQKYVLLIDELLSSTAAGKLEWRETAEPDTFQVAFPDYSVTLTEKQDATHVLSILNADGRRVDAFSDDAVWAAGYKMKLRELFSQARRQALSAEKALDEILNRLTGAR